MLVFITWVDEALMADEEVAAGEGLGTYLAYKGFLFGMSADVSL